jgi:hypothetical protein
MVNYLLISSMVIDVGTKHSLRLLRMVPKYP